MSYRSRPATAREASPAPTKEEQERQNRIEAFTKAREAQRVQGVKKKGRVEGKGPYQKVSKDCGAHGQSAIENPTSPWWHWPDALGMESLHRMIERGPTHKIVGCGICGSHNLIGILFSDPILPD